MKNMTITLPSGIELTGTPEQVIDAMDKLGISNVSGFYRSKTKGVVPISGMHTLHIKNAVLKIYRQWVADLSEIDDPQVLTRMIIDGPDDKELFELMKEMSRRVK